jgi:hypothetical protein
VAFLIGVGVNISLILTIYLQDNLNLTFLSEPFVIASSFERSSKKDYWQYRPLVNFEVSIKKLDISNLILT